MMRKTLVAFTAAMILSAGASLLPNRAEATVLPAAGGVVGAIDQTKPVQPAAYVCRSWWNGYRRVRRCFWRPGYRYRYWGPRRRYWRHRYYWRRY